MGMSRVFFRAANLNHGHWTTPYFDCNGKVNKWVITYASPFFGWDSIKAKLEFKLVFGYIYFSTLFRIICVGIIFASVGELFSCGGQIECEIVGPCEPVLGRMVQRNRKIYCGVVFNIEDTLQGCRCCYHELASAGH